MFIHDQNRLECSLNKGTHSQKRIVTVRAVGNMLGTAFCSVHGILKDNLNYVWIGTKICVLSAFCTYEFLAKEKWLSFHTLPTGKVQYSVNCFLVKESRCHLSVGDSV
jgi:hypothetical protein